MSSATPPGIGRVMSLQGGFDIPDDQPPRSDMYDALRDLFLGDEAPATNRPRSQDDLTPTESVDAPAFPRIEALVLGHLPVQQSPWVMQYARDAATQRGGPVGLLRIREGEATLDLIGAAPGTQDATPRSTLDEAIVSIAQTAKGLIVRVDATTEPILPGIPGVEALTLLTGADQAAVLGAYRTIKGLVAGAEDPLPGLRLAIMGSTPDRAMPAADKIQKAVESNLKIPVTVSACLARIGPGRSSLVFRGLLSEDIESVLARAHRLLERGRPMTESPAQPPSTPPAPEPEISRSSVPQTSTGVFSRLGHAAAPAPIVPPAAVPAPTPAPTRAEADSVQPASRSLASHLPGLRSTRVACPFQPAIEFALDERGALHLLVQASSPADVPAAAGSLLAASSWARLHTSLLALAMQQSDRPRPGGEVAPSLHLLTPAVKSCRGLPETGIHIHLLTRVEVEGKSAWFCTEVG